MSVLRQIFGLHAKPDNVMRRLLAALPFLVIAFAYWHFSAERHVDNPMDKLLPYFNQMGESFWRLAFTPDRQTGEYLLWSDTFASLYRLGIGVITASVIGLLLGVNMALFPGLRVLLTPVVTVSSIIPPLTLMPILLIVFGADEMPKIVLIFVGTVFLITRDICLATEALPREQTIKALTLGASELGVVYRVMFPQIMPRLINTTRLSLGAAWLFLIAGEALASTDGLGYRIFLVRRYLAMDVVLPYVAWITLIGFTIDWLLRFWMRKQYPWYERPQ